MARLRLPAMIRRSPRGSALYGGSTNRSVIVAAGQRLDVGDRVATQRQRMLRQTWQEDAWSYYDAVPEIQYATRFLANAASRMKVFPAAYAPDAGWDDEPVPVDEADLGQQLIDATHIAMSDLAQGRVEVGELMETVSTNLSQTGECYALGRQLPDTGQIEWSVRSVDEIMVRTDKYELREVPLDPSGIIGWIPLDPATTYLARMWIPHPRFKLLANCPMRVLNDVAETLTILRRVPRAVGRSRLAQNGIIKLPNGLRVRVYQGDNTNPESQPLESALTSAMVSPIADEGVAAAAAPIMVSGEKEELAALEYLSTDRKIDSLFSAERAELVGVIATGYDLPKEVLEGMADLNHWTAWQVGADTFSHHVEPHIVRCVDVLTVAYLRAHLTAQGIPQNLVDRSCLWYDPTRLLTNPNRVQDAQAAHDKLVISDHALRREMGFGEEDRPAAVELEERMVRSTRAWPPNVLEALLHVIDPMLEIPPMQTGSVPGMGPKGAIPVPIPGVTDQPAVGPGSQAPPTPTQPTIGPPATKPPAEQAAPPSPGLVAIGREAFTPEHRRLDRLSRRLTDIDRDLRSRLQVAASGHMARTLERAGARVRTKVNGNRELRAAVRETENLQLCAHLGPQVVSDLMSGRKPEAFAMTVPGEGSPPSLDDQAAIATRLTTAEWTELRGQYQAWVAEAQRAALETANQIAPIDAGKMALLQSAMDDARATGWTELESGMTNLANGLLFNGEKLAERDPAGLVPTGVIRSVLSVAGGSTNSANLGSDGMPGPASPSDGQIGTGGIVNTALVDAGASVANYEWVHGSPLRPFEPHAALDGVQFSDWTDDQLANPGDWPGPMFVPGDHAGCTCDYQILWDVGTGGNEGASSPADQEAV